MKKLRELGSLCVAKIFAKASPADTEMVFAVVIILLSFCEMKDGDSLKTVWLVRAFSGISVVDFLKRTFRIGPLETENVRTS